MQRLTWRTLESVLAPLGWRLVKNTPDMKVFQLGRQRISALRFPKNKWKVEVLLNNRIVDTGGFSEEEFAKVLTFELGLSRAMR